MSIVITLTPEEAHNLLVLLDLSLKHPDGGIKVMKAVVPLADKINQAVAKANQPVDTPAHEANP